MNQPLKVQEQAKYLFMGGLPNHPRRGLPCTIGWEFDTDSNYVMVYFDRDPRKLSPDIIKAAKELGLKWDNNDLGTEICHKDNLIRLNE